MLKIRHKQKIIFYQSPSQTPPRQAITLFYSMQTMVNEAKNYGIEFKDIPNNQRPSASFMILMDNYNKNPNNKDAAELIYDLYGHNSAWQAKEFWKIQNYNIGSGRGTFHPNDIYLKKPADLSNSLVQSNINK